jgi:hypothetical protein
MATFVSGVFGSLLSTRAPISGGAEIIMMRHG